MYKHLLVIITLICCGVDGVAQVSDSYVIQYVKDGKEAGKTEEQLVKELAAHGVTEEQAERIKKRFEENLFIDDQPLSDDNADRTYNRVNNLMEGVIVPVADKTAGGSGGKPVFGQNIFKGKNLTFEPNLNMATPENYRLGPGDEIIVHIWGMNEAVLRHTITPEGDITVKNIGPVYLSGMTVREADEYIRKRLSKIYGGVDPENDASQIKLTLGKIRTIQVNVMGEVVVPGTYRLSSFASLLHAVYCAGGISDIGSLRNIALIRKNKRIAVFDLYDMIMDGNLAGDARLMEGDLILVPPYEMIVQISGKVKRDMYYEIKRGETLASLFNYAGSFTGDAYTRSVRVIRGEDTEYKIYTVDEANYETFKLEDGDIVTVEGILDRFENRVEIRGAVYRSGVYELSEKLHTVKQLIGKAEGLMGDAFLNRAQLFREREDFTKEVIPIDLKALMDSLDADVPLKRNDVLVISSIHDIQENGYLTISGMVARPNRYPYAENTTLEDLILQAGGLLESASTVQVDVSRRIKDPKGMEPSSVLSEIFTFSLRDGLVIDGERGFLLKPFDDIVVKRSPAYQVQRKVAVRGEVVFEGAYTLVRKNERLSDLIKRARGLTADAYPEGSRLLRRMNEKDRFVRSMALRMATQQLGNDSIVVNPLFEDDRYSVGIELENALKNPGSDYDVVLCEGDELIIPEFQSTVRINGVVMYPNTVFYKKGEKLSYYINQSGGYGHRAKKSKVYIVYMNGMVSKAGKYRSDMIQPGCEIIVPSKKESKGLEVLSTILGFTTSAASVATMAAAVANLAK
ncbi:MAG: SLBB domain-containing protein, partial [Mediterranea sp.]|nr:SLBB domain-containing protein [Mediterranea sp.]